MKNKINNNFCIVFILLVFVLFIGCNNKEEKKTAVQTTAEGTNKIASVAPQTSNQLTDVKTTTSTGTMVSSAKPVDDDDIAVIVDGSTLKKSDIEKEFKEKQAMIKEKIPADKIKEMKANLRKQKVEQFIIRTVMSNEVEKRKIEATDKEIKKAVDQIRTSLPPGKKLDTFMKENNITQENIVLGIKVNKMIKQELGKKIKPTEKEIKTFYDENKEQFATPESVHVRHILVSFASGDDDKIKAEKRVKIDNLRKQIMEGADFAEIARKNSDCPSKDKGGDLGLIRKEQTVKPFEVAAFSQQVNAIGPVVATEFGYHIIQVLEKNEKKVTPLEEMKSRISAYLEQQKQSEAFEDIVKRLREKSKIIIYEN